MRSPASTLRSARIAATAVGILAALGPAVLSHAGGTARSGRSVRAVRSRVAGDGPRILLTDLGGGDEDEARVVALGEPPIVGSRYSVLGGVGFVGEIEIVRLDPSAPLAGVCGGGLHFARIRVLGPLATGDALAGQLVAVGPADRPLRNGRLLVEARAVAGLEAGGDEGDRLVLDLDGDRAADVVLVVRPECTAAGAGAASAGSGAGAGAGVGGRGAPASRPTSGRCFETWQRLGPRWRRVHAVQLVGC